MTATIEERLAGLESKLHEFEAKAEIREVLLKFCRGVDRNDQDCISDVYHPEAVADHGEFVIRLEDMPVRYGPALPGQVFRYPGIDAIITSFPDFLAEIGYIEVLMSPQGAKYFYFHIAGQR